MSTGRATAPRQLMVDVEDPPRDGWQFVPLTFQIQRHRSGPSNDRMPRGATSHRSPDFCQESVLLLSLEKFYHHGYI